METELIRYNQEWGRKCLNYEDSGERQDKINF
jgi:hypothetical protein